MKAASYVTESVFPPIFKRSLAFPNFERLSESFEIFANVQFSHSNDVGASLFDSENHGFFRFALVRKSV